MPNVMSPVPTAEQILSMGARSFEQITRDNGTKFFRIAEGKTAEERAFRLWLADTVQDLHNGEHPNDWRYEVIHDLFWAFLDYSDSDLERSGWDGYTDYCWEIAERLRSVSTSELFTWLADCPSRAEFDEPNDWASHSLIDLASARQREEIDNMAMSLIHACSQYQQELKQQQETEA